MEQIKVEKTITELKYKAIDGTLFRDQKECEKYEESAKCALLVDYKKMVTKSILEEDLNCGGSSEYNIDVVSVKTDRERQLLLQLIYLFNRGFPEEAIKRIETSINRALTNGELLLIGRGYPEEEDMFWILQTYNELLEHLKATIE